MKDGESKSRVYDEPNTVAANKEPGYCALQYGHYTGCCRKCNSSFQLTPVHDEIATGSVTERDNHITYH